MYFILGLKTNRCVDLDKFCNFHTARQREVVAATIRLERVPFKINTEGGFIIRKSESNCGQQLVPVKITSSRNSDCNSLMLNQDIDNIKSGFKVNQDLYNQKVITKSKFYPTSRLNKINVTNSPALRAFPQSPSTYVPSQPRNVFINSTIVQKKSG